MAPAELTTLSSEIVLPQGRPAPAYLLVGATSESVARELARRWLCGDQPCPKLERGSHPDLRWVRVAKTGRKIGIDQVRALQEDALYPPSESSYKIYIIADAERLSLEAANSLLRILEDPPPYLVFLLLAESMNLLPTIISRCQVVRLTPPAREQLRAELQAQRYGYSSEEAEYLLAVSGGDYRLLSECLQSAEARKPLEERARLRKDLDARADGELIMGFPEAINLFVEYELIFTLLRRMERWGAWRILEAAYRWKDLERERLARLFQRLAAWGRDLLLLELQLADGARIELINLQADLEPWRGRLAPEQLLRLVPRLVTAQEALRGNANLQLLLEARLLQLWRSLKSGGAKQR